MSIAFRASASRSQGGTAPNVTVPTACQVGDVLLVALTQNAADAVTTDPGVLTLLDADVTVAAAPVRLYKATVDGTTLVAGQVLSWALSASRATSIVVGAYSGADASSITFVKVAGTGATLTTPSLTTSAAGWLVELGAAKSNSSTAFVTTWTGPAGWTVRQSAPAYQTYAASAFIADKGAPSAAGTYGGDAYTADQPFNSSVRYTISVLAAAPVTPPPATATTLSNSFEGLADGTALTTANSASGGSAFFTVSPGTGGALTVRAAGAINGTRSLEVAQGSTACYCYWDSTQIPALPTAYFRWTVNLTAWPSAGASVWRHFDASSTEDFRLEILSTGKLRIRNSSTGAILADSTTVFNPGQAYRVEGKVVHGTAGTIQVRIYGTPNGITPVETMTPAAADMGTETSRVHMGRPVSTPTMPTFTLDDVAVTDAGWLGPVGTDTNAVPVANAGPDQANVEPWATVQLAGSGTDANGTITAYHWTAPTGITLSSTSAPNPTFTAPASAAAQTLAFSLTVTDNAGATSAANTVTITVLPATEFQISPAGVWTPMQVVTL